MPRKKEALPAVPPLDGPYAAAVLAGELFDAEHVRTILRRADLLIAADGGLDYLSQAKIKPDRLLGDMDSVDDEALARAEAADIPEWRLPVRKDDSDGALLLQALAETSYDDYVIYGAMGTRRSDHMLGNLVQALQLIRDHAIKGRLWLSNGIEYWLPLQGPAKVELAHCRVLVPTVDAMTISVVPVTAIGGYTTRGMDYSVEGIRLDAGTTRALSNRMVRPDATVTWEEGLGILCFASDAQSAPDHGA